jgi:hypothetical protein
MGVAAPRGDAPSVLFLTFNVEDYLSDSLFHGLRTILGVSVLDFPKKESSYRTYPHIADLYGHGFTLYGLLDDLPLERRLAMERGRRGDFDLIVFGDIWRNFGPLIELSHPYTTAEWRFSTAPTMPLRIRTALPTGAFLGVGFSPVRTLAGPTSSAS